MDWKWTGTRKGLDLDSIWTRFGVDLDSISTQLFRGRVLVLEISPRVSANPFTHETPPPVSLTVRSQHMALEHAVAT